MSLLEKLCSDYNIQAPNILRRRKQLESKAKKICLAAKRNGVSEFELSRQLRKLINPWIQHHKVFLPNKRNKQYYLGEVSLGCSNNVVPETWTVCNVSFPKKSVMHFEFDSSDVIVNLTNDETFIKGLFSSRIFAIEFHHEQNHILAGLYFQRLPLQTYNKKIGSIIKTAIALTFSIEVESGEDKNQSEDAPEAIEIEELYKNVKEIREEQVDVTPKESVQHPLLKPVLRPYQQDAVRWMLSREKEQEQAVILHPLYQELQLNSGTVVYFNKYTGHVMLTKPTVPNLRTGGILADEMGLGKTVEVLACILNSPRPGTQNKHSASSTDTSPTVSIPSKPKRKLDENNDQDGYVDEAKRVKVRDDWVKASSKKSTTRIALELWYEKELQGFVSQGTRAQREYKKTVQCICGQTTKKDTVMCMDCNKLQHFACLGYKKKYGGYRCPKCWMEQPLLESKATLIVCPISLRNQWCDEICKHIGSNLKLLVYEGSRSSTIYPVEFQKYDLVITTYNVLQADLRLTENGEPIQLRREPRYSSPGSPITIIKWWRLCLDEAQTVEAPSTMISAMAKKLHAYHRWAITGTPISKDISGLYGLIDYLQLAPYNEYETWKHLLYSSYLSRNTKPMLQFLAQILWRSSKTDVIDQINIPNQTVHEYFLEFSAVEKFYYKCEHEISSTTFLMRLSKYNNNIALRRLDKGCLKKLLEPLLSIRQACTYPLLRGRYLTPRKQVTSMKELLDALIEKNISEAEENLRIVVSSLNGLAGILLLQQEPTEAVDVYRKVLQLSTRFSKEESEKAITVDKLQLIHTLHNLAEIIEVVPSLPPTLRDHNLRADCLNEQQKYMEKYITQNIAAFQECETTAEAVVKLQVSCTLVPGQWYSGLFEWVTANDLEDDLVMRISNALENANVTKAINFTNTYRMVFMIKAWDEDVDDTRKTTIDFLEEMYTYSGEPATFTITEGLVAAATNCHLRPQKKSKNVKKCLICVVSEHMRQYEAKLFDMTKNSGEDISNKGSWKPTWQEIALKSLHNLGKTRNADAELINDGEIYFNVLQTIKKEFKQLRKFWTYIDQQVCAHDEIEICKTRLSLKHPSSHEEDGKKPKQTGASKILKQLSNVLENKLEFINLIEPHELQYQTSVLKNEEQQGMTALDKTLGTYSYLETLRRQQYAGQSPDPCPICKNALQDEWSILACGHCYCLECIQALLEKIQSNHMTCSVCRRTQKIDDISYIRTKVDDNVAHVGSSIKGSYSTKVEAVVKLILQLREEESNVKVLVFSTWISVLKVLLVALQTNEVSTELMLVHNTKQVLQKFKDPSKRMTALLLPVNLGSKGLNLIEATHVVLAEPMLDPNDQLQAIGRVHRIGQTRPTAVHKFVVKGTIEESIHHATSVNTSNWDKNKITLQQLKDLFIEAQPNVETVPVEESANAELDDELNDESAALNNSEDVDAHGNEVDQQEGSSENYNIENEDESYI